MTGSGLVGASADHPPLPSPEPGSGPSEEKVGRLKQRADFLRVAARRTKWATPGLVLQVAPQPKGGGGASAWRVGFTTSRKVGGAVERNRARRRLRAAVDVVLAAEARPGQDYVVIGRSATVHRPFDLLVADLRAALSRLGMRR